MVSDRAERLDHDLWLATRVRARHRRYQAPCRSATLSKTGNGDLRTPPEAANAMRVVLDWIVHSAASSGPRCDFAGDTLSLGLAGAPPIEAIEVSMAPAGVSPSLTSVAGSIDDDRVTLTLRYAEMSDDSERRGRGWISVQKMITFATTYVRTSSVCVVSM